MRWFSWEEEHLVDVRKSANIGHLWDENHLIAVHLVEMWAPDNDNDDNKEEEDDNNNNKEEEKEEDKY